jgi:DNA-binding beta-propeller fold protein YncE
MSRNLLVLAALAVLLPLAAVAHAQAPSQSGPYKVLQTVKVGGDGGMDYVGADSANRTLYVARSGAAGHIGVFNLDTFAQVGDIPGTSAHGAVVDDVTGHGFATSRAITMFDAKTFAIIKTIPVQGNPDGYLNDTVNHRFYDLSHSAPNITVIDDKDGSILTTIDIGGAPEQGQFDGKGKIYVDIEDKGAIAVIDSNTMKLDHTIDIKASGDGCAGLALDAKNGILFAACRTPQVMVIVNAASGKVITTLPIGQGCDGATFNPATMETFSSQGDGTLTVIKENSPTDFVVEQSVKTPVRAKTITLDTKTGHHCGVRPSARASRARGCACTANTRLAGPTHRWWPRRCWPSRRSWWSRRFRRIPWPARANDSRLVRNRRRRQIAASNSGCPISSQTLRIGGAFAHLREPHD